MPLDPLTPSSSKPVALIIPAYNEAGRISRVLAVAQAVADLQEIIVVDDGSTDDTWAEIQQAARRDARIRAFRHATNRGKGQALFTGARAAMAPLFLLLDADLMGLSPEELQHLMAPITAGRADMAIGVFRKGGLSTDLAHWVTPTLSGQRCLTARRFFEVDEKLAQGYGIETALTLTARRNRWRCSYVKLTGVTHPPGEFHRGFLPGIVNRATMYGQISRTWFQGGGWLLFWLRPSWQTRVAVLLLCLLLFGAMSYDRSRAAARLQLDDLPRLSLEGYHRLLVIAPHPDDETIGAGGLLPAALDLGLEVRVVVMTNGDGQPLGPLLVNGKIIPKAANYISAGQMRQTETLAALATLGLSPQAVTFLGYPDGGLETLWSKNWSQTCPLRARYTRAIRSPYQDTYNPAASYCGQDVLNDLLDVMKAFQPDLVVLPHPHDEHRDHQATSNFSMMALAQAQATNAFPKPDIFGYLVHYGYFPQPRNWHLQTPLLPPSPLAEGPARWYRFDLTPAQLETKATAIRAYASQLRLLGTFLPSFARPNELFEPIHLLEISLIDAETIPLLTQNPAPVSVLPEPTRESARRLALGSADLTALQVTRLGDQLWFSAQTYRALLPELRYILKLKYSNGETATQSWPGTASRADKNTFTFPLHLEPGDQPLVLGFAAEVREGIVLDRSAWHFLIIYPWRP